METEEIIDLVCKGFCRYYKGEKEEGISCEGFKFAGRLLGKDGSILDKIRSPISNLKSPISNYQWDGLLKVVLCERCEFLRDGCDFRGNLGQNAYPCGGYLFLDYLLDHEILKEEDMANV